MSKQETTRMLEDQFHYFSNVALNDAGRDWNTRFLAAKMARETAKTLLGYYGQMEALSVIGEVVLGEEDTVDSVPRAKGEENRTAPLESTVHEDLAAIQKLLTSISMTLKNLPEHNAAAYLRMKEEY